MYFFLVEKVINCPGFLSGIPAVISANFYRYLLFVVIEKTVGRINCSSSIRLA